jgi:hypothetical protein
MNEDIIRIPSSADFPLRIRRTHLPVLMAVLILILAALLLPGLMHTHSAAEKESFLNEMTAREEVDPGSYQEAEVPEEAVQASSAAALSRDEDAEGAGTLFRAPAEAAVPLAVSVHDRIAEDTASLKEAEKAAPAPSETAVRETASYAPAGTSGHSSLTPAARPSSSGSSGRQGSSPAAPASEKEEKEDKEKPVDPGTVITMDEIDESVLKAAMTRVYNPTIDFFWDCISDYYTISFPPGPIDEELCYYAQSRSQIAAMGRFLYADWSVFPELRDMAPGDYDDGAAYYFRREGDVYFVSSMKTGSDIYDPCFTRTDAVRLCEDGSADIRIIGVYDQLYNVHVIKEFSVEDGRYILRLQDVTPLN